MLKPFGFLSLVRQTLPEGSEAREPFDAFLKIFRVWPGIFLAVLAGVFLLVENFWPHGWTWHRDPGVGLIVAMIIFGCLAVLLINAVKAIIRSRRQHLAYEAMLRAERDASTTSRSA